jgi:glycosyltransferase involved in cell wall biosynthesis
VTSDLAKFVVATPFRSVCDHNAKVLEEVNQLRFLALGTRRGTSGVSDEHTRLAPWFGLINYGAASLFSTYRAESIRFAMHPLFDRWVRRQLPTGDHIISSYAYANASFQKARSSGGRTFLDSGNSHPENFWELLSEEHARWNCPTPPVARFYFERARAMMDHVDYVLCPSDFVRRSFLARGFKTGQILKNVYPVDLSCFVPSSTPRPFDRPLTIVNTGMLSLRKGTPYMLEAFRSIHQRHPSVRFLLTRTIHDSATSLMNKYRDLPIDWSPPLPHSQLAERLRSADVFVLLSIEEGLVRTALEAMACGLPVILTPNTGANDFVQPGLNGEIVPIRDSIAAAEAILKWGEKRMAGEVVDNSSVARQLSFETFRAEFLTQLRSIGLLSAKL